MTNAANHFFCRPHTYTCNIIITFCSSHSCSSSSTSLAFLVCYDFFLSAHSVRVWKRYTWHKDVFFHMTSFLRFLTPGFLFFFFISEDGGKMLRYILGIICHVFVINLPTYRYVIFFRDGFHSSRQSRIFYRKKSGPGFELSSCDVTERPSLRISLLHIFSIFFNIWNFIVAPRGEFFYDFSFRQRILDLKSEGH